MLAAAKALFDYGVKDEDAIVGTIAFAWYVEQPTVHIAEKHEEIEVLGTAGNVPVLRLRRVSAAVLQQEGAYFPSAVEVKVCSKHAKPEEVAALYEGILLDHFIEYGRSRGGNIGWSFRDACLAITIAPEEEVPSDYPAEINAVTGAKNTRAILLTPFHRPVWCAEHTSCSWDRPTPGPREASLPFSTIMVVPVRGAWVRMRPSLRARRRFSKRRSEVDPRCGAL
jgi:hypothetical protein